MNNERCLANVWATKIHLKAYKIWYEFMSIFLYAPPKTLTHNLVWNNESIIFYRIFRFHPKKNIVKHKIKLIVGFK